MAEFKRVNLRDPKAQIIVLHQTVMKSWLSDLGTFAAITAMAWCNHAYLGGSWVLDAVAAFAVITKVVNSTRGYHVTVAELREMLKETEPTT